MALLEIEALKAFYRDVIVLKGVSIILAAGELVSVVGANAAGKTTMLRTISGVLKSYTGVIRFRGKDISGLPPHEIVALGLIQIPEGRKLFGNMSVFENLGLGAYNERARKLYPKSIGRVFSLFPILESRSKQLVGTLSGGEQQMCAIARGLMSVPELLMLDEPSLGLAPIVTASIFKAVKETSAGGTTILLVEQNVRKALAISNRAYVLENGEVAIEGASDALLGNDHIKKAYLGL